MNTDELRFGIVGCGRIATRHADLLASGAVGGARLVAVCDNVAARAQAFAAKYQVPAYTSIEALLHARELGLDAVSILTPSGLHAEHVIQVAPHVRNVV